MKIIVDTAVNLSLDSCVAEIPASWRKRFDPVALLMGTNAKSEGVCSSLPWTSEKTKKKDGSLFSLEHVEENFAYHLFTSEIPAHFLRVKAVHGSDIFIVKETESASIALLQNSYGVSQKNSIPVADGFLFAGSKEFVKSLPPCAISTADCLAVALHVVCGDFCARGLVHAGWRGFTSGMLQNLISSLISAAAEYGIDAAKVLAKAHIVISPAIFGRSYECGADVLLALENHRCSRVENPLFSSHSSFYGNNGITLTELRLLYEECADVRGKGTVDKANKVSQDKCFPDLQLLSVIDFVTLGISPAQIAVLRLNTYEHPSLCSYRRACHFGGQQSARMYSVASS